MTRSFTPALSAARRGLSQAKRAKGARPPPGRPMRDDRHKRSRSALLIRHMSPARRKWRSREMSVRGVRRSTRTGRGPDLPPRAMPTRFRGTRSAGWRAPIRSRRGRRRARGRAPGPGDHTIGRAENRARGKRQVPPAGPERPTAAPKRTYQLRRGRPSRATRVPRQNSQSPTTSPPRKGRTHRVPTARVDVAAVDQPNRPHHGARISGGQKERRQSKGAGRARRKSDRPPPPAQRGGVTG